MPDAGKGQAPGRGEISPEDRKALHRRTNSIGERLRRARPTASEDGQSAQKASEAQAKAMGRALRLSTEMIGGIVVGSAIGWGLDQWLGTWPGFFILFFLLGSAAGMLNVVRSALGNKSTPASPSEGSQVIDDDDDN